MFRAIFLLLLLLTTGVPAALFAQEAGNKPTEILPENDDARVRSMSDDNEPNIVDPQLSTNESQAIGDSTSTIGAVQIDGSTILSPNDFSAVIEPFIGQKAETAQLQALAKAVADHARAKGYLFAGALVPAQSIRMGVIRVRLDEGVIDQVKVKGTGNRYVMRLFQSLTGRAGKRDEIEQAILQVGDITGFSVDQTSFERKNNRGVLAIQISQKPHKFHASVDNYGRDTSGSIRARLAIDWTGVFGESDWLYSQALTTPANPQRLVFVSTRYSNMFTDDGKIVSITGGAGKTRYTDRTTRDLSQSRSKYLGANISAPLRRTSALSLWLNFEGEYLTVARKYTGSRSRHDDVVTVTASVNGNARFAGGKLSGGVSATQGLDILGATRPNDPRASRLDASGQFTKGEMWLSWNRKLGSGFSLRTLLNGQIASRPLLSSQEIDVGGPRIGRGFEYSERSGDQGITGLVELRRYVDQPAKNISWAQVYAFGDGGYIDNLRRGRGGGSIMSVGSGIRVGVGKMEFSLELAVPVKGARGDNARRSPQINAAIGFSF